MIRLIFAVSLVLAAANAQGVPCTASPNETVQIHWSETKRVFSPNCKWVLDIRSVGEDGPAVAYIHEVKQGVPRHLFEVSRDAVIHWDKLEADLLVEDMEFSNRYRLMLFEPLNGYQSQKEALRIDDTIRADVEHNLKPRENIIYYLPKFVAWTDGGLVVSVGVITVDGHSGPFTSRCVGYEVAARPIKIMATLSKASLKKEYGVTCQVWP